jgi:hypothetical protein
VRGYLVARLTYDWPTVAGDPPGPGDTLVALRRRDRKPTGTCYLILDAHEVMQMDPEPGWIRLRLTTARITLAEAVKAPRWEAIVWYPR